MLRTTAGGIVLNDGAAGSANTAISAHGSGNILVQAQGEGASITANADILSGSGNVSVLAAQSVTFTPTADIIVAGGAGSIDIEAAGGAIDLSTTSNVSGFSGDIRLWAKSDVKLGGLVSTGTNVSITAHDGSILDQDGEDTTVDIASAGLRLWAGSGVGVLGESVNPLETTVTTLSARAVGGGINILETDDLIVGDTSATVQVVQANGTAANVSDATQSGLATSGGGSIVVKSTQGGIVFNAAVNANGSGNILVQASGDIAANADLVSGSGHIGVLAGLGLAATAGADVVTGGAGSIDLEAAVGAIALSPTSNVRGENGDIRLWAKSDVKLGGLISTGVNVSVTARDGSILDQDGEDTTVDIAAAGLRLWAGLGVGTVGAGGNPVETTVTTLSARAAGGGIDLLETDGLIIDDTSATVHVVQANGTILTITDNNQSDLVTTDGGSIAVRTKNGGIALNDGTAGSEKTAISANGAGSILVQALGSATDITANADLLSGSGHIAVLGGHGLILADGVNFATGGAGSIDMEAGTGSIDLSLTSKISGAQGDIRLWAKSNVNLGGLLSTEANVSVTAHDGSILDTDGENTTVDIAAAGLRLWAGSGVGVLGEGVNALETTVTTLSARANSGGVNILETDDLIIDDTPVAVHLLQATATLANISEDAQSGVVTTGGAIVLRTNNGSIVANDGGDNDLWAVRAEGGGNVLLQAQGAGSDLTLRAAVGGASGNVSLLAADAIVLSGKGAIATGGTGTIEVAAASLAMAEGTGATAASGNIRYNAATTIAGGNIVTSGDVSLKATTITGLGIAARNLMLDAASQAGAGNGHLQTAVSKLAANVGAGGLFITESDGLAIDTVAAISVMRVAADNTLSVLTDEARSDLTSAGAAVLKTTTGALTVNGGGDASGVTASGNLLLQAGGGITLNSSVVSTGGDMSLIAGDDGLTQAADGDLTTVGAGKTITVQAGGGITMAAGARALTNNGNIHYGTEIGDIVIGGLNAGSGQIAVTSTKGSILDGDNDPATADIVASELILSAGGGVGQATNHVTIKVESLAGSAGAGGLHVSAAGDLTIGSSDQATTSVQLDGTGQTVSVSQSGLTASQGGVLFLNAPAAIRQASAVSAQAVMISAGGDIIMNAGATTTTVAGGEVLYDAGAGIAVATINATGGKVTLKAAPTGAITDSDGDNKVNVTAQALNLIGYGVRNKLATIDDRALAQMKQEAIETKAEKISVATYSNAPAIMDVQTGENANGILRENGDWSLQFVNEGFFQPSASYIALTSIAKPAGISNVASWEYNRVLDYQLLNHLAAKSELVRSLTPASVSVQQLNLNHLYNNNAVGAWSETPGPDGGALLEAGGDPFKLDPLALQDSDMIPAFGAAAWEKSIIHDAAGTLPFEYWIEDMVL